MNGETPLHEIVPGLYQIGVSPSPAVGAIFTYFLTRDDVSPAVVPTLSETWEDGGLIGWYIFLNEEILDGRAFVPQARAGLPSLFDQPNQPNPRGIVWLSSVSAFAACQAMTIYGEVGTDPDRALSDSAEFAIGGFALTLPDSASITLAAAAPAFIVRADLNYSLLSYYGVSPTFQPYGPHSGSWYLVVALTGDGAGTFFQEQIALYAPVLLQAFFGGFRYFYQDGEQVRQLQYPFTIPVSPPTTYYGFNLYINPNYPSDPRWTRIELDLGSSSYGQNSASLRSSFFMTTAGGTITLAPFNAAGSGDPSLAQPGFGFCRTPASSPSASPDSLDYYLAPTGTFRIVQISGPTGSPAPGGNLWMPGLFAQEFFEIETGDLVGFVSGMPAYAPAFLDSQAGSTGSALDPGFQTAWARFPLGEAAGARGYFGQPSASVFYGRQSSQPFPTALSALLSEPAEPVTFPVVPYGGIYAAQPASTVPAQTFTAFEAVVLSGARHGEVPILPGGPRLIAPATRSLRRLAARADVEPVAFGLTPQGFLAGLDEAGSWILLTLARGPEDPSQVLSFGPPAASPSGTVDPLLGSALLGDQLFLVVSDPTHLGQFSNEIAMGGFNFKLDVGEDQGTILIFKYNTSASLADLARSTDLWSSKENFVSDLAATQHRILDALAIAGVLPPSSPADPDSPFAAFRKLAMEPAWTGVLALGCAIDGNGMPLDLQMLLGGINGQLRAHHLGIQSTPTGAGTASPTLESSSLFGVISYPSADQPPPPLASPKEDLDYEVELLRVVFANSKITQFHVTAGLTIHSLFGREVEMAGSPPSSPPDTLSIPGQYQVQGGVGVVLFNSQQRFVYTFPIPAGATRVLERIEFASASLVPVSSQPVGTPPTGTEIQSRFALGGQLWFAPEPFPGADGLDLFSFGTDGGLQFSNLTVNIQFTLDSQGAMRPGSKTVAFDWTALRVSPSPAAIRSESLLYTLPLQLSAFVSGNALQNASGGASPLHALQLEGRRGSLGSPALPGGSPQLAPAGYPYVTATPEYALQLDLPLGSLGSLSDVHVGLMARLFLGWGPSQLVPESDAAAVLVQLPQLSAGYGGFDLQGILRTTFGDANLLKVDLDTGPVYAVLFNNVKLSVLGYSFPPGYVIDFLLFGGNPSGGAPMNTNNLAWFLALQKPPSPSA